MTGQNDNKGQIFGCLFFGAIVLIVGASLAIEGQLLTFFAAEALSGIVVLLFMAVLGLIAYVMNKNKERGKK